LKTAAQYADEELAPVKASAKSEINGYVDADAYFAEQQTEIAAAKEIGLAAVTAAKSEEEIAAAVAATKAAIDMVETKAALIAAAKSELENYKADVVYVSEASAQKNNLILAGKTTLEGATSQADLQEKLAAVKAEIDELSDAYQMAHAQVNEAKAQIVYDYYSAENQAKINELYKAVKIAIDEATTMDALDGVVRAFIEDLNAVEKIVPQTTDIGSEKGCGSVVGGMGAAVVALLAMGFVCARKRED